MKFKQISAIKVGDKPDVVVFALDERGDIYAYHADIPHIVKGTWNKLPEHEKGEPNIRHLD